MELVLETAIPHIPLSAEFATSTSSTGLSETRPFTTRMTVPLSFSKTRKSLGPRKAIVVGASGAAIILFLTWLGVNSGLHYVISAAIGIETSIVWAFLLNDRITFKDEIGNYKLSNAFFRFLKYNASSLGGETINLSILFILTTGGLFYLYSEAIAILVAFIFNNKLSRKWVWAKK
ncbi:hypothetical protein BH18THE1_BH18THE1_21370 [soil metagenome]